MRLGVNGVREHVYTTRLASVAAHGGSRVGEDEKTWPVRALVAALGQSAATLLLISGCAGPFNQVTPCLINCAVTLNGSPATAPTTIVQPAPTQAGVTVRRNL